jgi:hypothetical protein
MVIGAQGRSTCCADVSIFIARGLIQGARVLRYSSTQLHLQVHLLGGWQFQSCADILDSLHLDDITR